jgi:hypothetical protein
MNGSRYLSLGGGPTIWPSPSSHAAADGFCSAVCDVARCGDPPWSIQGGRTGEVTRGGCRTGGAFACIRAGGAASAGITVPCRSMPLRPGKTRVTSRRSRLKMAARASIACRTQPSWPSPILNRTIAFVAWSVKTPMLPVAPITVPTRLRFGCSGACAWGGGAGGGAATATAGGRRDRENSGRSRVAESEPSGIPHNGFPIRLSGADWCGFAAAATAVAGRRPHAHAATAQPTMPTVKRATTVKRVRARIDGIDTASPVACDHPSPKSLQGAGDHAVRLHRAQHHYNGAKRWPAGMARGMTAGPPHAATAPRRAAGAPRLRL